MPATLTLHSLLVVNVRTKVAAITTTACPRPHYPCPYVSSATIQNLPPAIFTLMKSTEPWSDEYYSYDLEV